MGTLSGADHYHHRAVQLLGDLYGSVLRETHPVLWEYTDYYAGELGTGLKRRFVFFDRLVGQGELREIKLKTVEIESELSEDGKRRVNIDPGYLTEAKVVLASRKDYSHRLYLGRGVFAEVTLYYKHGMFRPHLFTYTDYRQEENIRLFEEMRETLRRKLHEASDYPGEDIVF